MKQYNLYWGDLHTHLLDLDRGDEILRYAAGNIDFAAVLGYPFNWDVISGMKTESTGNRPEFLEQWKRLQRLSRQHHQPGRFVTFLGYEWHGNRTRYGDHNVIYYDDDKELDDAWTLEELYQNLRGRKGLAIPHHTAYRCGNRAKDWSVFDETLSPVMEIFSTHGSSEGGDTPPYSQNSDMGPNVSGCSFQDALARGLVVGVIASNDGVVLPGRWGIGRAAVWAEQCTREAVWKALLNRRCYGVTGDRIKLQFSINDSPMGSVIDGRGSVEVNVDVEGSYTLDRIELIQNGHVADTYCHSGKWEEKSLRSNRYKILIEAGWGTGSFYGFKPKNNHWSCRLDIMGGSLIGLEKCFYHVGQQILSQDSGHCTWKMVTAAKIGLVPARVWEGIVFDIEGSPDTTLSMKAEGVPIKARIRDLVNGSSVVPLVDECRKTVLDKFGLKEEDGVNPHIFYANARKVKLHRAIPEAGYRKTHTFTNMKLKPGRNYFYIRVAQRNGQMAWSSPIWVDNKN